MDFSIVLKAGNPAPGGRLLILVGVVFFILVLVYVLRVRNTFASVPRLERPWLVLGIGVALLFFALLLIAIEDLIGPYPSLAALHDADDAIIAISAFVILAAMVMMKRAWTVPLGD